MSHLLYAANHKFEDGPFTPRLMIILDEPKKHKPSMREIFYTKTKSKKSKKYKK